MTHAFRAGLAALAAVSALALPAAASPIATASLARPHVFDGLFPKIKFHPKVDLGKTTRALTYPVKKAAVNGGKAAVGAAASYYIASKKPTVNVVLPHGK